MPTSCCPKLDNNLLVSSFCKTEITSDIYKQLPVKYQHNSFCQITDHKLWKMYQFFHVKMISLL